MIKHLDEAELTIFDTETTGLDPESGDRIVEIAAIRFKGKDRMGSFQRLINPGREISEAAYNVNHITSEMLQYAPTMESVMPEFLDFIKGSCICSYNAGFDMEFLNHELTLLGRRHLEGFVIVDILKMSRRLMPGLERYALWFVAEKLGSKTKQQHRAFSDVEMTLDVFNKLKDIMQLKGVSDFTTFTHLFTINPKLLEDLNAQKLAQIQEAIDLRVKLKLRYLPTTGGDVSEREVIPREIRQEYNHNYLVGYCCLRNEERTFRVDSILHLEIV
jgi:DNA polymerase-3 subunit alpha (Gram-positive type)